MNEGINSSNLSVFLKPFLHIQNLADSHISIYLSSALKVETYPEGLHVPKIFIGLFFLYLINVY